jgi:hypothetical protein
MSHLVGHISDFHANCLFEPANAYIYIYIYIYIKILNYVTNSPTCVGVSAPSSGSFDIAFAKLIKH